MNTVEHHVEQIEQAVIEALELENYIVEELEAEEIELSEEREIQGYTTEYHWCLSHIFPCPICNPV